jgi:hypothetical protein
LGINALSGSSSCSSPRGHHLGGEDADEGLADGADLETCAEGRHVGARAGAARGQGHHRGGPQIDAGRLHASLAPVALDARQDLAAQQGL